MKVLKSAALNEIDFCLRRLGGGNHSDNMNVLGGLPHHFLIRPSEDEFLGLVFLQNDEVLEICPRGGDRRLGAVARRAVVTPIRTLSSNWDLDEIQTQTRETLSTEAWIEPLFLRDSRGSEREYGLWYLQDGSHRALGCAMALIANRIRYAPIEAYCATARLLR